MTTEPTDPTHGTNARPGAAGTAAARRVFRSALRDVLVMLAGLTVLGVAVGALLAGLPGVWGALLGVGVAVVFSVTTVWTMYRTADSSPTTMAAVVMGGWLAKMVVVVVALVLLRQADFYDKYVFAAVLLVGAVASAYVDYRAVNRGRIPYVDPGTRDASSASTESSGDDR